MTRIAIVGAREHPQLGIVRDYVQTLSLSDTVISGGAVGVDRAAQEARVAMGRMKGGGSAPIAVAHTVRKLRDNRIFCERLVWYEPGDGAAQESWFYSLWSMRDTLIYRNTLIALDCDRMVIFPDGSRGGCWDAARQAKRFRRPCEVRWLDGRVMEFQG